MFAGQHGLKSLLHQKLTGSADCRDGRIQGRGDLAVAPPLAELRGVGFQLDPRLGDLPCRVFTRMDQSVEAFALLIAELHDILLHGNLFRGHD